ncbi:hypothetical protein [Actinoplanes regularis]|uniref:Uncharacterized protein n=1 Tax=Actinoplanes regularis TaxID=52697 RepID=A0A238ZJU0_9ACTN|nr:hypothetical protein [Actinoplanes regularis]GIE87636.1 hypothetical protein Are01nite_41160 [Actinoplanes regularis]GLW31596.1 hypothetical protein Areg01_45360 [Actinoplanes regularis]SNR83627.1 hypothetical protein SAMN06264365_10689 [Actinoplanes regularis]
MIRSTAAVAASTSVSGWVALRRAAIGAGLALAVCLLIGAVGRPIGSLLEPTVIIWSVGALYSGFDRHRRLACAAAGTTAVLLWLGVGQVLNAGLPGHVTRTAVGILAGSQVYALVTRVGRDG